MSQSENPADHNCVSRDNKKGSIAKALAHHQSGRLRAAEALYQKLLLAEPDNFEALYLFGVLSHQRRDYKTSVSCLSRAIQIRPSSASANNCLGESLRAQGKKARAASSFYRALENDKTHLPAMNNLANLLKAEGRLSEARHLYESALSINSNCAEIYNNLGNLLHQEQKFEQAISCFQKSLQINPNYASACNNLANILGKLNRFHESEILYKNAIKIHPDYVEARYNLGNLYRDRGEFVKAIKTYEAAIRISPQFIGAHWNLSLALLAQGEFESGWKEYEWRLRLPGNGIRQFQSRRWSGKPFPGKSVLIHDEQGLGDAIQFVRYANLVKKIGGTVFLLCKNPLVNLFRNCEGIDEIFTDGDQLPLFDYQVPLVSLPFHFRTTKESIPNAIPYLFVDQQKHTEWQSRMKYIPGYRVGVAWQGNPEFSGDKPRSIPLAEFIQISQIPDVELIRLQKGFGSEQMQGLKDSLQINDLDDDPLANSRTFLDTAAIIGNLDLVITSDTAVAHLAGASGTTTWLALPYVSEWRWLTDRNDSPWYPTMRIFRQKKEHDWHSVFTKMRESLREILTFGEGTN